MDEYPTPWISGAGGEQPAQPVLLLHHSGFFCLKSRCFHSSLSCSTQPSTSKVSSPLLKDVSALSQGRAGLGWSPQSCGKSSLAEPGADRLVLAGHSDFPLLWNSGSVPRGSLLVQRVRVRCALIGLYFKGTAKDGDTLQDLCLCCFHVRDSNPPSCMNTPCKHFWDVEGQLWRMGEGFQGGLEDTAEPLPPFPSWGWMNWRDKILILTQVCLHPHPDSCKKFNSFPPPSLLFFLISLLLQWRTFVTTPTKLLASQRSSGHSPARPE